MLGRVSLCDSMDYMVHGILQARILEGACERDVQCRAGTCCAVSLWLRGLRVCTPLGRAGEECHPGSHKVPFFRKRQHHACPCLPNLLCSRGLDGRYRCSTNLKNINF
ncbi:hypothetical protein FD755_001243 [Muntiacus reevesi]|uniref:Prokineticin-1 n=2 Tax=Pecora TaxID=35500 RepID=A0A5J5N0Q8_MUNRE|nr:hypothetical protein FD755_001243 [Muntiacus reevesi]